MHIDAEPFWVPKQGNREEEYEDAVWPWGREEYKAFPVRVAVADGATESSYARRWADQLVRAVGRGELTPGHLYEEIAPMRADWRQWMSGLTLPWYAEEKAAQGAFAALLLLELSTPCQGEVEGGNWHAAAVGDSCLFQVRGEEVVAQFPLENAADFNNHPFLLGSVEGPEDPLAGRILHREGTWARGDSFYLMTDALAAWFLREAEGGGRPQDALRGLSPVCEANPFPDWVQALRERRLVRNDDCTLLRLRVL